MPRNPISRRTFLQTTAASATLAHLAPALAEPTPATQPPWPENGTLIPDTGWHLWVDEHAQWQSDTLYLPEDVNLAKLPTNPPTGGWASLHTDPIPVTLPSTVEQHCWGKYTHRPYTPEEYRYAADDPIPQNGAYFGVSWWYKNIDIPASWKGKRIFLHIRGAHLRAEVYLNQKLVGYSIMEELPFEADLTAAANFSSDAAGAGGDNLLAIRITNPFGRFDWVDGLNAQWGAVKLYRSHGFGGLDRGLTISAHDEVRIKDCWVLNTSDPRKITFTADIIWSHQRQQQSFFFGTRCELIDPDSNRVIAARDLGGTGGSTDELRAGSGVPRTKAYLEEIEGWKQTISHDLTFSEVELWDISNPKLYWLKITVEGRGDSADTRTIPVAFRTFAPSGIGSNALFRLNGQRIKLYSSISWGFWGINGMWPTPELAEKEVTQAKKLGLNCLNFHRNLAKEDVLRAHDRLGLLRYMEPGAGKLAIGNPAKHPSPADSFAQRYMLAKCVGMVRAFRSHPSVIIYCLQNEIGADLANPDTLAVLAAMRAEDPSRCIVLNDGFVAPPRKAAQAWYEPWNDKLHRSDEHAWGDWWNQHQGAGDQWYDEFYKAPTDFTYKAPHKDVLTEFGEMEGCATPDNHSLMLHQHANPAATGIGSQPANASYDHTDHAEIEAATARWIEKWGFQHAFPTNETLWNSLGKKCYDTWQNYMENARISDELDMAVISGWESTAIENHSGIVDNLRNFKSDPTPIAATLQPIRPVAKQRSLCTALGQPATFDLYLLNDTGKPATGTLTFTAITPSGKLLKLTELPAPTQSPDIFSYLLQEAFTTPPLTEEGLYRFKFAITSAPQSTQTKEIWVTELPSNSVAGMPYQIGVSGITSSVRKQLNSLGALFSIQDFKVGRKYTAIITSGLTASATTKQESGDTTGLEAQPASVAGPIATTTQLGHIDPAVLEAARAGTPLLVIPQADSLSEGCAQQLAAAGAFTYHGTVGDFRAPWMGNWYFVRQHPLYAGLPVDQCMGIHYQARGRESNGLIVEGPNVEIIAGYSRDHDRNLGAGTFTTKLGTTKIVFHRIPTLHPVLQQRFLANALYYLTT